MMPAKLVSPVLFETKVVLNKASVHDVTKKFSTRGSNYCVDVVMWVKLGNSSISTREVVIISFICGFG